MNKPNFWDNTHPLSAENERLYKELVPSVGNCKTLQGELLRASSKIGYDWYNNGWGANNWSGAVVFISKLFYMLPVLPEPVKIDTLKKALTWVANYSHGEPAPEGNAECARAQDMVTTIHEFIVEAILANPVPITNTRDMYDFNERPYSDLKRLNGEW